MSSGTINLFAYSKKEALIKASFRAGNGTRTRDLLLGKETFYQLNHARTLLFFTAPQSIAWLFFKVNPFCKALCKAVCEAFCAYYVKHLTWKTIFQNLRLKIK